jgi:hypothetical protein
VEKKATANKPKPKPIKIDDFDEDLMVNTISKQIDSIRKHLFRVFFTRISTLFKYICCS